MTVLKVGIADYEAMKDRTMQIARGEIRPKPDAPKIWFTSIESLAKVLSVKNRELLRVIAESSPSSIEDLAELTGRAKSNLSRTLNKMAEYGLVVMEQNESRDYKPKLVYDQIAFDLPLFDRKTAASAPDLRRA